MADYSAALRAVAAALEPAGDEVSLVHLAGSALKSRDVSKNDYHRMLF